jgi:integrase/recombinase XerD
MLYPLPMFLPSSTGSKPVPLLIWTSVLGHEDLKTTQIYTQVAIRTLKQIHAATHPAAMLDKNNAPSLPAKQAQADDVIAEQLFAVLDAEAEEEKEE